MKPYNYQHDLNRQLRTRARLTFTAGLGVAGAACLLGLGIGVCIAQAGFLNSIPVLLVLAWGIYGFYFLCTRGTDL